jgi:hypothetical protein
MKMTEEDVKSLRLSTFAVSRDMVSTMSGVEGVHIWVNFTESGDGIYAELRSKALPVNEIAARYGGGGTGWRPARCSAPGSRRTNFSESSTPCYDGELRDSKKSHPPGMASLRSVVDG